VARTLIGEWRRSPAWVLSLVLAGCTLAGCAGALARRTSPVSSAETPSAAHLIGLLREREAALQGLAGTAKVEVRVETLAGAKPHQERLSGTQAVLVRAPASFRFEALSPFGVAYVVASDGSELATYLPGERIVYRGPATAETIGIATGVSAGARDVVALLLGRPPADGLAAAVATVAPSGGSRSSSASAQSPDPELFLHVQTGEKSGAVLVGFGALAGPILVPVFFERLSPSGDLELRAHFADFEPVGSLPVAKLIEVATPGIEASLRYSALRLDAATPSERFVLATPPGVKELAYQQAPGAEP